jgi:heme/copper-type cytochrome/quinol oxidase subunit 2
MSENDTSDVLPDWANQTLILLWLLLFGGRWLLTPVFQMAGMLSAPQLAALDENVLLKLYLVLLVVTCVVVALRAVRRSQSETKPLMPVGANAVVEGLDTDVPIRAATFDSQVENVNLPEEIGNPNGDTRQTNGHREAGTAGGDETLD